MRSKVSALKAELLAVFTQNIHKPVSEMHDVALDTQHAFLQVNTVIVGSLAGRCNLRGTRPLWGPLLLPEMM